jgi:hypothetical protein
MLAGTNPCRFASNVTCSPFYLLGPLAPPQRPTQIDCPNESPIRVSVMNGAPLGHQRICRKVVAGPACENDDLEMASFLSKQPAKPIHPALVALD